MNTEYSLPKVSLEPDDYDFEAAERAAEEKGDRDYDYLNEGE